MNALHSQSLLTLLLYGEKQVGGDNCGLAGGEGELVTALFDDDVGEAAGSGAPSTVRIRTKKNTPTSCARRSIIRMIDGGTYHFGDSGIHGLFDDAGDDLGAALNTPA